MPVPLRAGTGAVGDASLGSGARARQPRRRLWRPTPSSARPGAALAVAWVSLRHSPGRTVAWQRALYRRGAAAGWHRPQRAGEAAGRRGTADGPSVRPVWPEKAAGQAMLPAEPQYRRRFKFWERGILGAAPRGRVGGAGAGAALPSTPLSPSPSRSPCRGGCGYVGRAALLPRPLTARGGAARPRAAA